MLDFSIASVVGLPIGTMLAQISNWHVSFGVISILTIISLVSLLLIVPINTPQTRSNLQNYLPSWETRE
ncbi:hypothetical protein FD39_GL000288 [Lactobacillus amylolyticus DSM 11664]|uniref:MFS transporter n=1 Tax=Lactobacillus amylolyticus TaxID=83683 RepID=UPI0006EEC8EA|nr:MFS transporter [Lactobacillus amylolyticus]KRL18762.1 hypothetical protein FD39_GL000288 [Lactobacillus amylolyticus DSM 11664]